MNNRRGLADAVEATSDRATSSAAAGAWVRALCDTQSALGATPLYAHILRARLVLGSASLPDMLISTMNDLPGWQIDEVLGEVFGFTVRSRNWDPSSGVAQVAPRRRAQGHDEDAGRGPRAGDERLVEEAESKGGNAVVAFRFDTSELGNTWTEICAYGTAVRARKPGA